jgi:hypothetical protein
VDYEHFERALQVHLPVGRALANPGGGSSTVLRYTGEKVAYLRGRSTIYVRARDLYEAYSEFRGRCVKTSDLKAWAPGVFDSSQGGHNCNSTLLLLALQCVGAIDSIEGQGRRGDPFRATINNFIKK